MTTRPPKSRTPRSSAKAPKATEPTDAAPPPARRRSRRATPDVEDGVVEREAAHTWRWKASFRRHAFGWKSQPPITRIKEAVSEIQKIGKKQPMLAAEGAVAFLERVSPALERVDSSSGAIGSAVRRTIEDLVPLIANAPADPKTRDAWLDRLFTAYQDDAIPYIESLGDHWGELCASKEVASAWADRLVDGTKLAWSPDPKSLSFFKGCVPCLGALVRAERYDEVLALLEHAPKIWHFRMYGVKALAAQGKKAEAIRYAEDGRWAGDHPARIARACEGILLSSGLVEEAYRRYGLVANQGGTYLATFRAVAKKYPHKHAGEILADLVATTPGDEGKWFAAAKEAGLFEEALALARRTPCDPKTLTRAARDFGETQPAFAEGAGLLALHWIARGYGFDLTGMDVVDAYRATLSAAARRGESEDAKARIRAVIAQGYGPALQFVQKVLGRELGL
ncbi:MAG: hypothetical protein U0230_16030 [Polyangiales bacterium]